MWCTLLDYQRPNPYQNPNLKPNSPLPKPHAPLAFAPHWLGSYSLYLKPNPTCYFEQVGLPLMPSAPLWDSYLIPRQDLTLHLTFLSLKP